MSIKGIDVSAHNGSIDWAKVKSEVDFVMIRAGFGKNNIDDCCITNIVGCSDKKIPYGLYWFSYALTADMAKKEADYVCDIADKYKPEYPIAYDWEYDSDDWANTKGVRMTNTMRSNFAVAFLDRVKERGYTPMLYTNIDYLNKGFSSLTSRYYIWLAQWGVSKPSKDCVIWQDSDSGRVSGISGRVDTNISYKDFRSNINTAENTAPVSKITLNDITNNVIDKYTKLANDIINGKYGNGATRKKKLTESGYDYAVAQMFVNYLLSK